MSVGNLSKGLTMKFDNKPKILVVDDKELLRSLTSFDYEIVVAETESSLLEKATIENPDLIVLEIGMRKMDGYTICTKLKKNAATQNIPVILITAWDKAKGLELGAIDYITKPFQPSIVKARIKNYIALKRQNEQLQNLSAIDALTGVSNRHCFDEFLEQQWRQAIRGIFHLSLIMMDIDDFKSFNTGYGKAAGDNCLKKIAAALKKVTGRATDLLARYDGDKFACVLPLTDAKGALTMAKKLRESIIFLRIPHAYSNTNSYVTISQGVACRQPYPNSTPTLLLADAEKALLDAKARRGNQIMTIA